MLNQNGEPIQLITDRINADSAGNLFTENGGFLGKIGVFAFEDNGELVKNNYGFFVSENEGAAATDIVVHQKWVERANIDLVQQMTGMITAERAYQSAAEVTKIYDDVMRKSTEEVGRL